MLLKSKKIYGRASKMILAKIDGNTIIGFFTVIGFVVGFLTQNPWTKKYVPAWLTEIMGKLPPDKVTELVSKYGTTEARRETATESLKVELEERGIIVDSVQAGQLVDYLGQRYRETIGKLIKR
jgi:hypothetical protein